MSLQQDKVQVSEVLFLLRCIFQDYPRWGWLPDRVNIEAEAICFRQILTCEAIVLGLFFLLPRRIFDLDAMVVDRPLVDETGGRPKIWLVH